MKFKATAGLALLTIALGVGIYVFDYKKEQADLVRKEAESHIVTFDKEQINYLEIHKNQTRYVIQKGVDGWTILEPVQDLADNEQVESLLDFLTSDKYLAIAKQGTDQNQLKLQEFGLDNPDASITIKNNLGKSQKIYVGSVKNFEGNSFVRVESENRILVASPLWQTKAEQNLMTYREKRLYRSSLAKVFAIKVKSLRGEFGLERVDGTWKAQQFPNLVLNQNKVRDVLKQIAEAGIKDYVIDGEPSNALIQAKKLANPPVLIEFSTDNGEWSVAINQHEADNAVYALTEHPTNLLKIEPTKWELFGNLNLDMFRDRTSAFQFALNEVSKIYFKNEKGPLQFSKENGVWTSLQPPPEGYEFSSILLVKLLSKIHDLQIAEFLDREFKDQASLPFGGRNMIILKTDSDNLIMQINWGPELRLKNAGSEKDFYFARTNLSTDTFALEKALVSSVDLQQVFIKKETKENESNN